MIEVPVVVKDALREGRHKKNYIFQVLNDDGTVDFAIDNDNLVSESVSIDERMCTGDTLKFGLCEGTSLEFQYFGKSNILGRRIQCFIDVDFPEKNEMVWIDYATLTNSSPTLTVTDAGDYQLTIPANTPCMIIDVHNGRTTRTPMPSDSSAVYIWYDNRDIGDIITIAVDSGTFSVNVKHRTYRYQSKIPMGYFTVKKCSRQASTGIIKVTAYNKLQSDYLDSNANELIIGIVQEGEDGVPDEATVDTILLELLSDYTIGTKFIPEPCTLPTVWADLQTPSGWYFDGQNRYDIENDSYHIGAPYIDASITIVDDDPNGAYRFYVNRTAVRNFLLNKMGTYKDTMVRSQSGDAFATLKSVTFGESGHDVSTPLVVFRSSMPDIVSCKMADGEGDVYSDYMIKKNTAGSFTIKVPLGFYYTQTGRFNYHSNVPGGDQALADWITFLSDPNVFRLEKRDSNEFGSLSITTAEAESFSNVTLRDLQSSVFEISCQFGQLDRQTDLFSGVELNHSRLLPAGTLYPSNSLYPDGAAESAFRSQYSKLWADEGNVRKWRYLVITYKGLDENQQEKEFTLQRTVNANGTDDYNMSDNWLFRNLVWTASQVGDYADAMVLKMQGITWFPFEMWAAGLPYLEVGDEIEIPLGTQTYTSYILQRKLKGIQNLEDTYINGTLDIF